MIPPIRTLVALSVALALPAMAGALAAAQDEKAAPSPVFPKTIEITGTIVVEPVRQDVKKTENAKPRDKDKSADNKVKKDAAKRADALEDAVKTIEKAVEVEAVPAGAVLKIAGPMQVRAANANLDPIIAQFLPQMMPMMRTELHLLLTVTEATPAQRKAIVADRDKAAREAAKKLAQSQQRRGGFHVVNEAAPDPRKLVQEALADAAKAHLAPEQFDRYKAEVARRAEDHKNLAIGNILAKLDQDLILSPDQIETLRASLSKNWNPAWCQSLEMLMGGDQLFPAVPDSVVVPALNPKQKQVWQGTMRNNGVFWAGMTFMNQAEDDDAFPADEQPTEPKDKAAKDDPAPRPPAGMRKAAPKMIRPGFNGR